MAVGPERTDVAKEAFAKVHAILGTGPNANTKWNGVVHPSPDDVVALVRAKEKTPHHVFHCMIGNERAPWMKGVEGETAQTVLLFPDMEAMQTAVRTVHNKTGDVSRLFFISGQNKPAQQFSPAKAMHQQAFDFAPSPLSNN